LTIENPFSYLIGRASGLQTAMGNDISGVSSDDDGSPTKQGKSHGYSEFFSSAGKTIGEASGIVCGNLNDTYDEDKNGATHQNKENDKKGGIRMTRGEDLLCGNGAFSPNSNSSTFANPDDNESLQSNPMSALFARALLNEVTDNPATMRPIEMAAREKKLLKAQKEARTASKNNLRAVGGQGTVRGHLNTLGQNASSRIIPPNLLSENRAQVRGDNGDVPEGKHRVTIGLMLSRRDNKVGHGDTVTRQTAFDFNKLQDRQYKYVSSTDAAGWRAGGGESGTSYINQLNVTNSLSDDTEVDMDPGIDSLPQQQTLNCTKVPSPDTVHIPIIHIDCDSASVIDSIIALLARGEVFIPHMSVLPEALGVNGISPPDLVVGFGCERNDDTPPEDWPNWCLEFMHNQLYEYFSDVGAKWMKRPFKTTLAKKVRWKTVKHMNKFFSHSESVINTWRENGAQYLDPQPSYIEGGASPEEVARPHGIYLLRNGKPTNYFAPNFEPPYTTKMTRSLLLNVVGKSWDKKRRDWSSEPIARVTTSLLLSTMCGCAEPNDGGFIAREATNVLSPYNVQAPAFFNANKGNVSPVSKSVSSSDIIAKPKQPTTKSNTQQQSIYDNLKVKREDSGIRRSQLGAEQNNMVGVEQNRGRSQSSSSNRRRLPPPELNQQEVMSSSETKSRNKAIHDNTTQIDIPESTSDMDTILDGDNDDIDDDHSTNQGRVFDVSSSKNRNKMLSPSQKETPTTKNRLKLDVGHSSNDWWVNEESEPQNDINIFTSALQNEEGEHFAKSLSQSQTHHANRDSGISVGESQTTVPIMNGSSAKFMEQERKRKKQREIQREKEREKIDKLEKAIEEKMRLNQEKLVSHKDTLDSDTDTKGKTSDGSSVRKSKKEKKAKKEKKKREKKERRERERSQSSNNSRNPDNMDSMRYNSDYDSDQVKENFPIKNDSQNSPYMTPNKKSVDWSSNVNVKNDSSYLPISVSGNNNINESPKRTFRNMNSPARSDNTPDVSSQPSLDYSMDTASMMGDGSLIGGQFAGDASVFTAMTSASDNKSLLSCVTRSTVHDMSGRHKSHLGSPYNNSDQDDDISLSLMASTSSGMDPIPSDEELFVIGWAKAMDPNSGSYYYFTLDRSKIVWDNPLSSP